MSTFFSPLPAPAPFPFAVPVALGHFNAGVILESGRPFIVGSFCSYEFALQIASEYVLDLLCVPHVRADRALKTSELRAFSDTELISRAKYLRSGWAHKMARAKISNELARIVWIQRERERGLMGGQESSGSDASPEGAAGATACGKARRRCRMNESPVTREIEMLAATFDYFPRVFRLDGVEYVVTAQLRSSANVESQTLTFHVQCGEHAMTLRHDLNASKWYAADGR